MNSKQNGEHDKSVCFVGYRSENFNVVNSDDIKFFMDSRCTDHLVNKKKYFFDLIMLKEPIKISITKNKDYLLAIGVGNIKVTSVVDCKGTKCTIKNILFVPTLRKNLLPVKRLNMAEIKVIFENGKVKFFT